MCMWTIEKSIVHMIVTVLTKVLHQKFMEDRSQFSALLSSSLRVSARNGLAYGTMGVSSVFSYPF